MLLHSAAWAMESVEQGIRLFNQKEYQQAQQFFSSNRMLAVLKQRLG
ncbi:hypothetical protein [Vibrio furnissii]|nr:hypothetical protein [Vibrio furnissii]MCG6267940.1 hypothetical protein [Vibrio furnissii]UHJ62713.1 hypothetical protein LUM42_24230 [Vibrio furnissii]